MTLPPPDHRLVRLLLVRHGQTTSNVAHRLDTAAPGAELTPAGATQAEQLAMSLGGGVLTAGAQIAAIYASTLVRAQRTAAPLARALGLAVHVRSGLAEISAGDLEMRADLASVTRYLSTAFAWPAGDLAARLPGGEDGLEMLARFDRVVAEVAAVLDANPAADGAPAAVLVSHGAAIRVWAAARADNVDAPFAAANPLANAGVVVVEGHPAAGWRVASWTGAAGLTRASAPRPRAARPRRPRRPS